jgi:hypothetical protein
VLLLVVLLVVSCNARAEPPAPTPTLYADVQPETMTELFADVPRPVAQQPLTIHPDNPHYFADAAGNAVYLTGSHYWWTLQDGESRTELSPFDYDAFLDFLVEHNHNYTRMWVYENTAWAPWTEEKVLFAPHPYARTGPGEALDGLPKFDLEQFNQAFFDRLRERVIQAGERGIYVSVMFFQGWSYEKEGFPGNPWPGNPLNPANNINGIDGDLNDDGNGLEVHTLQSPEIVRLQEQYVRKMIDTLNDLDNVLWEISNESAGNSTEWQYHMIRFVNEYQATLPQQHPVGMTAQWPDGDNAVLFESPADWISPSMSGAGDYRTNPPPADGSKIILSDTDHLWGIGGNRVWVWKTFTRGQHPIFMDPYGNPDFWPGNKLFDESLRANMGFTRLYAERMNLAAATPSGDLCSTEYCLANPDGAEYLVYFPEGGSAEVDLSGTPEQVQLAAEWFEPATGAVQAGEPVAGGATRSFTAPFAQDAVLYLSDQSANGYPYPDASDTGKADSDG